jgi:hypothetical protein
MIKLFGADDVSEASVAEKVAFIATKVAAISSSNPIVKVLLYAAHFAQYPRYRCSKKHEYNINKRSGIFELIFIYLLNIIAK